MLETTDTVEELRTITVGRITYCVVAALPVLIFLHLLFDPGQSRDDRLRDFMLGWILVFLNVPTALVGIGVLIWQRYQRHPMRFWLLAVFVSSVPLLFMIVSLILEGAAGIHIRPFT